MKYDVCLMMTMLYRDEVEASTVTELCEKIDKLKKDDSRLFKNFDISKSGWSIKDLTTRSIACENEDDWP